MYYKIKILLVVFVTLVFSNCRKYSEGGKVIDAKKNLFANGGVWYIDKYEINGVDSTNSIYSKSNLSSNYELSKDELKLIFKCPNYSSPNSSPYSDVSAKDYRALFDFSSSKSRLKFYSHDADCICWTQGTCMKFIFFPESKPGLWDIIKLTKNEITLCCKSSKNSYLIKLTKS
jgi:hypothetical protein